MAATWETYPNPPVAPTTWGNPHIKQYNKLEGIRQVNPPRLHQ